ncbi:hypothetical protein ABFS82_04G075900 [Erythranthe guttata]|uniref:ubiquitin-like-conjugating enzyme ATG10 isoform X2 n=1 Tax=Erythranthe guttata TaxID=4155 RepID=UPI00064D971E|nr:PREDICTED: ubiquitin-like-conjugating enzyme ATG10 isoform X2 [Erythranthe guttata]|eukprot:XP_012846053.1 PREDICTED: ubiquitin-like-conjugating enzyme ATG10 isoform X2 [Erythranthe guttata]
MAESWDGTLSSTEFYVAASAFAQQWRKFNSSLPHWSWLPSPNRPPWIFHDNQVGYLCVERVILPRLSEESSNKDDDQIEKEDCNSEYEDEFVDTAVLVQRDGRGEHRYDFHVVYSASYRVPVLYFRAYCNDGQPLSLDDIEKDIPVNSAELITRSKWTFMTQQEHPILDRPWYTLHPCGTSEWMKLLINSDASIAQNPVTVEKYMVSWFSVVGQVFGLKIPFEMLDFAAT